jgi:hypothetical protein
LAKVEAAARVREVDPDDPEHPALAVAKVVPVEIVISPSLPVPYPSCHFSVSSDLN